jgi:hypothetical protein
MRNPKTEVLVCVLCSRRYSLEDVERFDFFPTTGICVKCYQAGKRVPYLDWCFGKTNIVGKNGKVVKFGYDAEAKACSQYCPDKKICALFVSGEIQKWRLRNGNEKS